MITIWQKKGLVFAIIVLLSLGGSYLIWYGTYWGPEVFGDSTGYIYSARNLVDGHGLGLFAPSGWFGTLGYFAPFYPLVLSGFGFAGFDLVMAARWLNIVLFGMTISLTGVSFYSFSRSPWLSISLSVLIATAPKLVARYIPAMTEPLFYFIAYTGIFLLVLYLEKRNRSMLTAAAIVTGLAFLTRNLGLAYVSAGVLGLLLLRRSSLKRRVLDGAYFAALSGIPMIIWRVWLQIQPHKVSAQRFEFTAGNLWERLTSWRGSIVNNVWSWLPLDPLFPSTTYRFKLVFLFLLTFLIGVVMVQAIRKRRGKGERNWFTHRGFRLSVFMVIFILGYLSILAISVLYFKPTIRIDSRQLSSVLFASIIAAYSLFYFLIETWPSRKWLQGLPVAVTLIMTAVGLPTTLEMVSIYHQEGSGFTSARWHNSGTIEALKGLPEDTTIITNEPEAILFHLGRPAYTIKEISRSEPLTDYTFYGAEMDEDIQRIFREDEAALVLINTFYWQLWPLYGEGTAQRLKAFTQGLEQYSESSDGAIYFYDASE